MNPSMAAIVSLTLNEFSDDQIAAMMNALSGFGRLQPQNIAFNLALERQLIKDTGTTTFDPEDTLSALDLQIRRRPAFGLSEVAS